MRMILFGTNQSYYDDAEKVFCSVLADYADREAVSSALFRTETRNMQESRIWGKGFYSVDDETALGVERMLALAVKSLKKS